MNDSHADKSAGCIGKQSFVNIHAAKQALQRGNRKQGQALNTYKCTHCHYVHIGAPTKRSSV